MVVPTRRIETAEFRQLIEQTEGDTVPRYVLGAFSFVPPRPGEQFVPKVNDQINILQLNSMEPLIYKDPSNGVVFVILPLYQDDQFDYAYMHDIHPNKKAWGYYLINYGTRIDDVTDYIDGDFVWFNPEPLPAFDISKELTH